MGGRSGYGAVLFLGWVLAAACGGGPPERDDGAGAAPDSSLPADSAPVSTPAADTTAERPPAGPDAVRSRIPPDVLVREGACPFECCTYGEWTSTSAIPLFAAERDRSEVVDTIPAGATFTALTGNVHITGLQLLVMTDTLRTMAWASDEPGNTRSSERAFLPGDTVVVLDHMGEGFFNVWHDGEVWGVEWFWGERPDGTSPARVVGEYETEWWVRAETRDGVVGWIPMDETPRVRGADACG